MGFLVPAFAAFAVLAAVPVLLHLYGRPRAEPRRFAAIRFLIQSDRKSASRRRLQRLALLWARALAIAAVPLLLAKPYLETRSPLGVSIGESEAAVIILDDSRSMGLRDGSQTRFAAAQARARRLVAGLGSDSEAAVLLTSLGAAAPQAELTADRRRLTQAIDEASLSLRPGDTSSALRRAAAILTAPAAAAPGKARRVYLISDMAAHGFSGGPAWGEGGPDLLPLDVGGKAGRPAPPNRAVVALRAAPAPQLSPRGVEVAATLANFGTTDDKDVPVTLRIDGRPVAKGLVDIPARGRIDKRFFHVLGGAEEAAGGPAAHEAVVELGADALDSDDRRYLPLEERRGVRVLVVDGDPRTVRRQDEVFYLETALLPGDRGDSRLTVKVINADELGREPLETVDVIFAANLKAPDADTAARLGGFVAGGGGLFLSVGDNVDCDAWNERLGDLLPQPLSTVRTVGATLATRQDGEAVPGGVAPPADSGERIARLDRQHPLLTPFAAEAAGEPAGASRGPLGALRQTRVSRYVLLRPTPQGGSDEARRALLRLDSGAPLLVEGKKGSGRVLLLTTTIDRDWADLAIQPAYLPLVQQAARYLARAPLPSPAAAAQVGEPHDVVLAEGDGRAEITLPGGEPRAFGEDRLADRQVLQFTETLQPGVYGVRSGGSGRPLLPLPGAAFAVNVDALESDLLPVDPAVLAALSHPSRGQPGGSTTHRTELWHHLGALLLVLLLIESLLAIRR